MAYAVIVKTKRTDPSWVDVSTDTKLVHLNGLPFLWAVEKVLAQAPNLETLQIIPLSEKHFGLQKRVLLEERRIALQFGHWLPNRAWDVVRSNPDFRKCRKFMLALQGRQKELWEKLVAYRLHEALQTIEYLQLDKDIPESADWPDQIASDNVAGVLCYISPELEVSNAGNAVAKDISLRMRKICPRDDW